MVGAAARVADGPADGPDVVVASGHGSVVSIEVKAVASRAEPGRIATALPGWNEQLRGLRHKVGDDVYGVLVADTIPSATKAILRDHGWGWFDRRGELDLRVPGLIIHTTDLEPDPNRHGRAPAKDPIRGRAGFSVAACLLVEPGATPGVREMARAAKIAPSSASEALADLREASLLTAAGAALVPELFWTLADAWGPRRYLLAAIPPPGQRTRLAFGLDDLAEPGWAVGGTIAAAAWSAPVVVGSAAPPDFYVADEAELRAARRELGDASSADTAGCTLAVAPTRLVVCPRFAANAMTTSWLHWPIVHPLFAALDLAQDRARGVEILEGWTPPAPFTRVW